VLNNVNAKESRKLTCAVQAAHWVELECIVTAIFFAKHVVNISCGRVGMAEKIVLENILK
jgi:hypothetical protein